MRPIVIVLTARTNADHGIWVADPVELVPAGLVSTLQQSGFLVLLIPRDTNEDQRIEDALASVTGIVSYEEDEEQASDPCALKTLEQAYGLPVLRVCGSGTVDRDDLATFLERLSG